MELDELLVELREVDVELDVKLDFEFELFELDDDPGPVGLPMTAFRLKIKPPGTTKLLAVVEYSLTVIS